MTESFIYYIKIISIHKKSTRYSDVTDKHKTAISLETLLQLIS